MTHTQLEEQQPTLWQKLRDNIFWVCLVGYLISFFGGMVTLVLPIESTDTFWSPFALYFEFWGSWLLTLLIIGLFKSNRYILSAIGKTDRGNTWPMFFKGIGLGFALNAGLILLAYLHRDFQLTFVSFQPVYFLLMFLAVLIQSSAEELVCRVFIYQRLRRGYKSPWVAVIANPIFFAALHLGNEGVKPLAVYNLFIIGLFFSLIVYYFDSFWMAATIHTAWNFTQNILFGLPNSGRVVDYSVFKLFGGVGKDSFFYHTNFGIEGTIATALVFTLCCIGLYVVNEKKKPRSAFSYKTIAQKTLDFGVSFRE